VEIPVRRWKENDVVEVVMPFTKHLDFGPDKMETAPAYEKGGKTDYAPMWTGTFMYGPLVMTTTGIRNWDEATIDVAPDLSDIVLMGASEGSGADAHLYTLTHQGHTFMPDYAGNDHVTHYFRMNIPADPNAQLPASNASSAIDKSQLRELLLIAKSRNEEQQAWNALTVKVPEYAPWATHGFSRMMEQAAKAQPLMDADEGRYSQEEIDKVAGALNAAINTMRPGNLPELEDMEELQQLLEKAKLLPNTNEKANRAISYAGMVIRYVSDGSGTMDMIQRATNQLKEVLK
jgi:hypothetical protein